MPLVGTAGLARAASARGRGLGAFNVVHLDTAEAYERAARRAGAGLVLQVSENAVRYHGALEPIGTALVALARRSDIPLAVHLDHAESVDLIHEAVSLGFSSVMYDGSRLPDDENVATTLAVTRHCHGHGVDVEAELGEVGGKNGAHHPTARTDPEQAARFVAETGVDLLAVAVGSSHAMSDRSAALDLELVARLRQAVPVPLVLHGSSGVPDEGMVQAVARGMTKINVATHLNRVFTETVRTHLAANPAISDTRVWFAAGNAALEDEATRLLGLYDGAS
jgi:fructose-bisphosphate aldolase, class II